MKFYYVEDGVYRGENPKGFEDLMRLRDWGVVTWLHIENGFQRIFRWPFGAQDWQVRLGEEYLFMPFSNLRFPRKDVLEWCAKQISRHAGEHRAIYVCCKHGKDRTGIVIAYWRVKHCGWNPAEAWAEAQHYGMHRFYRWLGWQKKFYRLFDNG